MYGAAANGITNCICFSFSHSLKGALVVAFRVTSIAIAPENLLACGFRVTIANRTIAKFQLKFNPYQKIT
jgi:hypothetical protein